MYSQCRTLQYSSYSPTHPRTRGHPRTRRSIRALWAAAATFDIADSAPNLSRTNTRPCYVVSLWLIQCVVQVGATRVERLKGWIPKDGLTTFMRNRKEPAETKRLRVVSRNTSSFVSFHPGLFPSKHVVQIWFDLWSDTWRAGQGTRQVRSFGSRPFVPHDEGLVIMPPAVVQARVRPV